MPDTLLGGILINEILVDPNSASGENFDTDGNGTAQAVDEYVELYNNSTSAIDISGLQLWDAGNGNGNWFTFPSGSILAPGAHAMVMAGVQSSPPGSLPTGNPGDLFFEAERGTAVLNNGGDNVTLLDSSGAGSYIQATFNGATLDEPTNGNNGYSGFPSGAVRSGSGENFGNDTDGLSLQRIGDGSDTFSVETPTPGTTNICFANGTRLATPNGPKKVEELEVGDLLTTARGRDLPIRWIFVKSWAVCDMHAAPNLAPVRIRAGTLGASLPERDLYVSQQHRILIEGPIAKRMFGEKEVLVPAKALLSLAGVTIHIPECSISYYHILMDEHHVLLAEGLPSESLYLGPQAITSIPDDALNEAMTLLGLTKATLAEAAWPPARLLAPMKKARRLVRRHRKNEKPITV